MWAIPEQDLDEAIERATKALATATSNEGAVALAQARLVEVDAGPGPTVGRRYGEPSTRRGTRLERLAALYRRAEENTSPGTELGD